MLIGMTLCVTLLIYPIMEIKMKANISEVRQNIATVENRIEYLNKERAEILLDLRDIDKDIDDTIKTQNGLWAEICRMKADE